MSRARRNRGRDPRRGPFEWASPVAEGLVEGLLDFLSSWGRK
ncbi:MULTISPECIES: hypothetical protein [Streptomyces]|nr:MULTISPECIES: hypothetical protein [Streptomyces]WGK50614.1 hypothetical protein M6G09_36165 [Streptomyces sp. B146]